MDKKSFEKFYKKSISERQDIIKKEFELTKEELDLLKKEGALSVEKANNMVENVIGTFSLPLGIATNFNINKKDYIVPMSTEEASVVAAASNGAKLSNGFTTSVDDQIMVGQAQIVKLKDAKAASEAILKNKKKIMQIAISSDSIMEKLGGGPVDLKVTILKTKRGDMLDVHLLVNVLDAMGANAINTMMEKISSELEELSGGEVVLKIISNLAIYRRAQAKTIWTKKALKESTKGTMDGEEIVERILDAYEFAVNSPYRAATHNKGIMNGIDAVLVATGNDFRAVEAGAHAFASFESEYSPLTKYYKDEDGNLVGEIDIPLAVGTVGGTTKTHPLAQISLKILGTTKASELASVIASVGLAQNFSAMRALATTGIQAGHMKLHAKNIASQAGATGKEVDIVAKKMIEEKNISQGFAEKILKEMKD
jgi:hydroxymethylglutaryl-CoA reductase